MSESRFAAIGHLLIDGTNTELGVKTHKGLIAVFGAGQSCQLKTDAAVASIWIPLRGRMQVGERAEGYLPVGELRVLGSERIHAVGRGNARWLALLAKDAAWTQIMHARLGVPVLDASPLPAQHSADIDLRRRAVRVARAIQIGQDLDLAAEHVIERIISLQSDFAREIDRCPGRTYGQRRQVFARLQRVRNYLLANCTLEIGNRELAHLANYSPTHFIRAFQSVYGETPHKFLVKQRLRRAAELVRFSSLAINEVAIVSGFESPSAFSRLFRRRFGMTAGTMRRLVVERTLRVGLSIGSGPFGTAPPRPRIARQLSV